jgi:Glycosyltransferase family 9 (heptosyltransferase)
LIHFEKLAAIPGVRLISLQRAYGAEQIRELDGRFPIIDLGAEADPDRTMMEDTPAIMMGLDLVITPDTALAHLAGALGVPVWIALPSSPDWRWLLDREDSPWYPTARLFRQSKRGRWDLVFDRIARALEELVESRNY